MASLTGRAPAQIHELASAVKGWLSAAEGDLLYTLARQCTSACIVEIGSYQGKSTTFLAAGSEAGSRVPVYAIDPHSGSKASPEGVEGVERQIARAGLSHLVRPIVSPSTDAAPGFHEPIEFLFIDGNHQLRAVTEDWDMWVHKVIPGGYVALHDTVLWSGPSEIAETRLLRSGDFVDTGLADSITFGRKRRHSEPKESRLHTLRVRALKRTCNVAVRIPLPPAAKHVASRVLSLLQK